MVLKRIDLQGCFSMGGAMPSVIEINFLRQLAAFAETGTLSAASEKLFISQPALTRSMQKLEDLMGVELFTRRKNRLYLNENGKLAAALARRVIEDDESLVREVRDFDRRMRTVALGCCAPVPMMEITPCVQAAFTDKTVTSEVRNDPELLQGLADGTYQIVITHEEPEAEDLCFKACGSEQLYISLPPDHPLASRKSISFKDLDGVPILQYSEVGFWYELTVKSIPHPHLLMQRNRKAFIEISNSSVLPTFFSDYFFFRGDRLGPERRVIRLTDEAAHPVYYLVCRAQDADRFRGVFDSLPEWSDTSMRLVNPDAATIGKDHPIKPVLRS
jgi:DNA-binding transcriptional LysR family regulator